MDKFCEDCIHNSVCHYGAYCPSGHCNDKDTLDDLIPQGEWVHIHTDFAKYHYKCSTCGRQINTHGAPLSDYPFCHCGAKMQKGDAE